MLGTTIDAGGEGDGEAVLDLLATHPATATFIATKLARRFVADEPPPALVARAAATFTRSRGDLRAVVRTILTSPEFLSAEARRAKVKTPFEFVVSALRVTRAEVADASAVVQQVRTLGMPLYFAQPPTGYADTAAAWVNTGALVGRMNFAVDLTANRVRGVRIDLAVRGRRQRRGRGQDLGDEAPAAWPGLRRHGVDAGAGHGRCRRSPPCRSDPRSSSAAEVVAVSAVVLPTATAPRGRRRERLRTPSGQLGEHMISRRVLLRNGGLALLSLGFAPAFVARTAAAGANRRKMLVTIFQRGAADGLNIVVPFGERDYYTARPTIAIAQPGGGT